MIELIYTWNKMGAHFISIRGRSNHHQQIVPLTFTSGFMQMPYPIKVKNSQYNDKEKCDVYGCISTDTAHITDIDLLKETQEFVALMVELDNKLKSYVSGNIASFTAMLKVDPMTPVEYKSIIYNSELSSIPSINFKCINTTVFEWKPSTNSAEKRTLENLHFAGITYEVDASLKLAIPSLFYWYDKEMNKVLVKPQVYANEIFYFTKSEKVKYNPNTFTKFAAMYNNQANDVNAPLNKLE